RVSKEGHPGPVGDLTLAGETVAVCVARDEDTGAEIGALFGATHRSHLLGAHAGRPGAAGPAPDGASAVGTFARGAAGRGLVTVIRACPAEASACSAGGASHKQQSAQNRFSHDSF